MRLRNLDAALDWQLEQVANDVRLDFTDEEREAARQELHRRRLVNLSFLELRQAIAEGRATPDEVQTELTRRRQPIRLPHLGRFI